MRLLANAFFDIDLYDDAFPHYKEALTLFRKLQQNYKRHFDADLNDITIEPSVVGDILNCLGSIKQV